jgi:hypothetical protein
LVGDPKGRMFTARFVFDSKIAPDLGRQLLLIRSSTCHTSGFWKTQSMVQKECNIHIVFLNIYHNDELLSYLLMYTSAIFFQHPSTQIYLIYSVLSMKSGQNSSTVVLPYTLHGLAHTCHGNVRETWWSWWINFV